MYQRILIPTDGSDEAENGVAHGIELAATVGATVHALYVIEEGGNPWMSEPMDDQLDRARQYGEDVTGAVADRAAAAGLDSVTAVELGPSVSERISEYAKEEDIDLIVIGSGYHGKFGGLLGSVAEKVLRTSEVPVTTVSQNESR